MPDGNGAEPVFAEEWHLAGADGRPLVIGITGGGDVWVNGQSRLSPDLAVRLSEQLALIARQAPQRVPRPRRHACAR
jgi:hypothetical protein